MIPTRPTTDETEPTTDTDEYERTCPFCGAIVASMKLPDHIRADCSPVEARRAG